MVADTLINFHSFRKRKSRSRILMALERFYTEVLLPAQAEPGPNDNEELEEFMVDVLADRIIENLDSARDFRGMDNQYRQFDQRLRSALQLKIKSRARFESMQRF